MTTTPPFYVRLTLAFLRVLFRRFFKVEVHGLEHYAAAAAACARDGRPLVMIANHTSLLDAPIINAFLPERPTYLVNTAISRWWVTKLAGVLGGTPLYPLDQTNPLALRALIGHLREHGHVRACVFPEGRLSPTGRLMKVYDGTGLIVDKLEARVLPIHMEGLRFSKMHLLPKAYKTFWRPRVVVTVRPAVDLVVPEGLKGKARRQALSHALREVMATAMVESAEVNRTLMDELVLAAQTYGADVPIVADMDAGRLTYGELLERVGILGEKVKRDFGGESVLGLMLPNSVAAVAAFFGIQYAGKAVAMLNFSAGSQAMLQGCAAAGVKVVLTSRRFIEKAALGDVVAEMGGVVRLVYLEDVRDGLTWVDKLRGVRAGKRLVKGKYKPLRKADDCAVVLFTSGSEGAPKGVALSHRNLLFNRAQVVARLDVNPADSVLNALPMFHSFGLGVCTLMPLFEGVLVTLYPTPTHVRMVPEMIYDSHATLAFGTDTFLARYARVAHPMDFGHVRGLFAGGEKLREETRRTYMERFGVRILEGYGVTETSPVVAINTVADNRAGSMGMLLPGMEMKLVPVEGVEDGRRLWVRGANVMLGYLKTDRPGVVQSPLEDGWYDTGDVVRVDGDGFLFMVGRAKRFAKIGGEMVSLAACEEFVGRAFPDFQHAVVAVPDAKKGEKLVMVTTGDMTRADVVAAGQAAGVGELLLPREVMRVRRMPVLGTGKPDYGAVMRLVEGV